jgi:hypothetical protein
MVDVVSNSIHVRTESIDPCIAFEIEEELDGYAIPIGADGWVLSADEKHLANLMELPNLELRNIHQNSPEEHEFSMVVRSESQEVKNKKKYIRKLMFTLNKNSLDYIEDQRQKTKNCDVVFSFILNLTYLKSMACIGSFAVNQQNVITYTDRPTKATNPQNTSK